MIRLGVNIDHVATLRNARGGIEPDPIFGAHAAILGGADQITVHLREDRRHIRDRDVRLLKEILNVDLNLEMAAVKSMVEFAIEVMPEQVTLVPEKREERTTEGGLDLKNIKKIKPIVKELQDAGIPVVTFVEPDDLSVSQSAELGVEAVELHTGRYANATGDSSDRELDYLASAAALSDRLGLFVHAGHGLNYHNTAALLGIDEIREVNIGHSLVSRAMFCGLEQAVREMKTLIDRSTS